MKTKSKPRPQPGTKLKSKLNQQQTAAFRHLRHFPSKQTVLEAAAAAAEKVIMHKISKAEARRREVLGVETGTQIGTRRRA